MRLALQADVEIAAPTNRTPACTLSSAYGSVARYLFTLTTRLRGLDNPGSPHGSAFRSITCAAFGPKCNLEPLRETQLHQRGDSLATPHMRFDLQLERAYPAEVHGVVLDFADCTGWAEVKLLAHNLLGR